MSPILDSIGSVKSYGWGAAVAAGAYESIASATGTGSSGTITFSSIPSTYKHLQIRINALATGNTSLWRMRFNGDTGSNYSWHYLVGNGTSSASSGGSGSATSMYLSLSGSSGSANLYPTVSIVDIHDYASTTKNKTERHITGFDNNLGTTSSYLEIDSGAWYNTAAITSIEIAILSNSFATTATFALYGIKGA